MPEQSPTSPGPLKFTVKVDLDPKTVALDTAGIVVKLLVVVVGWGVVRAGSLGGTVKMTSGPLMTSGALFPIETKGNDRPIPSAVVFKTALIVICRVVLIFMSPSPVRLESIGFIFLTCSK